MAVPRVLFGGGVFLASFLLFLGEPMAAKQLLPAFGGSSAVWMTCLVFFQVSLLLGYLYAHWMARAAFAGGATSKLRVRLHLALLVLAVVSAIAWAAGKIPLHALPEHPVGSIFALLTLRIGLPFLILGSTGPLLQVWFFRIESRAVPYGLFALSNLASLLALFLYPSVLEPYFALGTQRWLWGGGVVVFAAISATLAWRTRLLGPEPEPEAQAGLTPTRWQTRALWFLLPMAGAMQLSAVTGHLTSNIAAIPLLWIVPLAVYLLSFILAFEFPWFYQRGLVARLLVVLLAALGYVLSHADITFPIGVAISFFLAEMFLACLLCHAETFRLRPKRPDETTLFYLLIACGGAVGSFLIGMAAPVLFTGNYDLSITFFVTAVLALLVTWDEGRSQQLLWATVSALLLVLVFALRSAYQRDTMLATRNFYGSLRVRRTVSKLGDPMRTLLNGSIQHGTQIFSSSLRQTPTTYYAPDSGVGMALSTCCEGRPRRIGVVGLGAGTIAAYGKRGDSMQFYEINPAVRPVASNLFTYLRESGAKIGFVEGDARASLTAQPAQNFDVLVIDAFSGDAIPLHLLTQEAMAVYRRHLAPGGILAFHVSNRYVDLEPEVGELARASGFEARTVGSARNEATGEFSATWVLVTADGAFFARTDVEDHVAATEVRAGVKPWTDGYSSLVPLIRW
jgi:SAM-dependent methyltransferase